MKVKSLAYRAAALSPLPLLVQRLLFPGRLTILSYHAVTRSPLPLPHWCFLDEESFAWQMGYLKRRFEVLPLTEGLERLKAGALRRPTAAITFDDGFQNNFETAFPLLRAEGLPATVFLVTGLVGSSDTVWYCRLNKALGATALPALEWEGRSFDLSSAAARTRSGAALQSLLKALPPGPMKASLRSLVSALGDDPDAVIGPDSPYRMLDWDSVAAMQSSGLIEFGSHTHTHAILSRLQPEGKKSEIGLSLDLISRHAARPCRLFAYPNGRPQDYDDDAIGILKQLGVAAAVTEIHGANSRERSPHELKRYDIGSSMSRAHFQLTVHGVIALARGGR